MKKGAREGRREKGTVQRAEEDGQTRKMDQKDGWLAKRRCTKATTSEQLGGGERKKREERSFADILGSLEHNTSAITRAWTMVKLGSG